MASNPKIPVDFTRYQWASRDVREWYAPLFREASDAFEEVERLSVVRGIRKACYQSAYLADVPHRARWAVDHGLIFLPTSAIHLDNTYSATEDTNAPNALRYLLMRPDERPTNFPPRTDADFGDLLGFPKCCQRAFAATWGRGQFDNTWEQGQPNADGPIYSNTLFRWTGLRFVPHLPCSLHCEQSETIGKEFEQIGNDAGYREHFQLIRDVLSWPVQWSRLFGIAEIVSPAIKLVVRSDWTPTKQHFIRHSLSPYVKPAATLWTDNGFSSHEGMRAAHTLLLNVLDQIVLGKKERVLDLGCGNGLLLKRLQYRRAIQIAGVERDPEVVNRSVYTSLSGKYTGQIQSVEWDQFHPDVVLINPRRLEEMTDGEREHTIQRLQCVPTRVFYGYDDCGNVVDICRRMGFTDLCPATKTPQLTVVVSGTHPFAK